MPVSTLLLRGARGLLSISGGEPGPRLVHTAEPDLRSASSLKPQAPSPKPQSHQPQPLAAPARVPASPILSPTQPAYLMQSGAYPRATA